MTLSNSDNIEEQDVILNDQCLTRVQCLLDQETQFERNAHPNRKPMQMSL